MNNTIIDEVSKNIVEMMKLVQRLDEKLLQNEKDHKEILDNISNLCKHVNEENERMSKRINTLEDTNKQFQAYWKLFSALGGVTGVISLVTVILKYLGVI